MKAPMNAVRAALLVLGLQAACAAPACVSVTQSGYRPLGTEAGVTTLHWSAELANACDAGYDADLSIELFDDRHEVISQTRELVSIDRHGIASAGRDFIVPASDFARVRSFGVRVVEEREQPF